MERNGGGRDGEEEIERMGWGGREEEEMERKKLRGWDGEEGRWWPEVQVSGPLCPEYCTHDTETRVKLE